MKHLNSNIRHRLIAAGEYVIRNTDLQTLLVISPVRCKFIVSS